MKMTEEQKQMVTDNYKLVYEFMWRFHLDADEWEDILALALCKRIHLYDPAKGKPSTFIMKVLQTAYFQEVRDRKTFTRRANYDRTNLSLDFEYDNEDSKESCIEFFANDNTNNDPEHLYITRTYIEFINELEGRHANVFRDVMFNNMRQVDVAKKYKIAQAQVSRDCRKVSALLREEFGYAS